MWKKCTKITYKSSVPFCKQLGRNRFHFAVVWRRTSASAIKTRQSSSQSCYRPLEFVFCVGRKKISSATVGSLPADGGKTELEWACVSVGWCCWACHSDRGSSDLWHLSQECGSLFKGLRFENDSSFCLPASIVLLLFVEGNFLMSFLFGSIISSGFNDIRNLQKAK